MPIPTQSIAQGPISEAPFFFHNGPYRLFGILHHPVEAVARGQGFVFCHPCFEEKLWTHRVFVSFARELTARGYHVLRFDYMGHGDSDGDFEHATISTRLSDLACAISILRREIGAEASIGLLGLRLGATLAAEYAERDPKISHLMLWDPITEGAAYMQEVLLSNLATQSAVHQQIRFTREDLVGQMRSGETVNIEGYELSHQMYEDTTRLCISGVRSYAGPCMVAQIARNNQKPKKNLELLCGVYPRAELILSVEEPFWKEIKKFYAAADNIFSASLSWLQRHGG